MRALIAKAVSTARRQHQQVALLFRPGIFLVVQRLSKRNVQLPLFQQSVLGNAHHALWLNTSRKRGVQAALIVKLGGMARMLPGATQLHIARTVSKGSTRTAQHLFPACFACQASIQQQFQLWFATEMGHVHLASLVIWANLVL